MQKLETSVNMPVTEFVITHDDVVAVICYSI